MASVLHTASAMVDGLDASMVGRVTFVLILGLVALSVARRARASLRHLLLATTFITVLALPVVMSTTPAVTIPVPVAVRSVASVVPTVLGSTKTDIPQADNGNKAAVASLGSLLRYTWAGGALLLLILLAVDLRRLRALKRGGLPWPAWNGRARSIARASGVGRGVEVLLHEGISAPLTCGVWSPAILFPIDASEWSEADVKRALVHELEHVRRCDWATQLLARIVCACYWFHPLVWMAWTRLSLEAERACDDAVVQRTERTEYAAQLVRLARRLSGRRPLPLLAMANRSDLSARVAAVLDVTRRRGRTGYLMMAIVFGGASLAMLLITSVRPVTALPALSQTQPSPRTSLHEPTSPSLPTVVVKGERSSSRVPGQTRRRPARNYLVPPRRVAAVKSPAPISNAQISRRVVATQMQGDRSTSIDSNSSESSAISTNSTSASATAETNGRRVSQQH